MHSVDAQIPPTGKYNTTNYPEDRKVLEELFSKSTISFQDSTMFFEDDYIAVGPYGRMSYGFGDVPSKVVRTETYIKQHGKWYFVSGHGSRVQDNSAMMQASK